MKRFLSLTAMTLVFLMLSSIGVSAAAKAKKTKKDKAAATASTLQGYTVTGNNVKFTFNVKDYASFDEIESVTVSGEFNGWDPAAADWQATDDDKDGIWVLETTTDKVPCGSKFKFVSNQVDWNQPAADKLDKKFLADDGFGGFNLVIVCE